MPSKKREANLHLIQDMMILKRENFPSTFLTCQKALLSMKWFVALLLLFALSFLTCQQLRHGGKKPAGFKMPVTLSHFIEQSERMRSKVFEGHVSSTQKAMLVGKN